MEAKNTLTFVHEKRTFELKYHDKTTESELATVIWFLRDSIKEYFETENVKFLLSGDPAGEKEILENLDSEIWVVTEGEAEKEDIQAPLVIYINKKNQLIRIVKKKRDPKSSAATRDMRELHEILSFDINKLDQSNAHDIESDKYASDNLFKAPLPVINVNMFEEDKKEEEDDEDPNIVPKVRKKVPIKDGVMQQKFMLESMMNPSMSKDPNSTYYTLEEVAQHKKASDCWTVWQGKVYDITKYIKAHPGGKKIMAGAGKDCTELFNKYHHWVNANFIIGKLQIGVLKY